MKLSLESTDQFVTLNGVPARVWEGTTASGVRVHAFITRIAVHRDDDGAELERELTEHRPPTVEWPTRMVL